MIQDFDASRERRGLYIRLFALCYPVKWQREGKGRSDKPSNQRKQNEEATHEVLKSIREEEGGSGPDSSTSEDDESF